MRTVFSPMVGVVVGLTVTLGGCGPAVQPTADTDVDAIEDTASTGDTDTDTDSQGSELPTETPRVVLHELFSGSNCGPCNEADANVMDVLYANEGRYSLLAYQVGSDPYVTQEAVARRMYYLPGESSYTIPYCHADGENGFHPNEMNNDVGYTQADFDAFAAVPSSMLLELTHAVDVASQTITVTYSMTALGDFSSTDLRLHIGIIEGTTYKNVGSNGQTEFHNVLKKMVPTHEGTPVGPFTRGDTLTGDVSWTFQGSYTSETGYGDPVDHAVEHTVEEFEDLSAVAFIQDNTTWAVHQSAMSGGTNDSE